MNWKKGFQRTTLVLSGLILLLGFAISIDMGDNEKDLYEHYSILASKAEDRSRQLTVVEVRKLWELEKKRRGTSLEFDPDKYSEEERLMLTGIDPETGESYERLAEKYRREYWGKIREGALITLIASLIPWAIFGVGLYLARGFMKSN
jgi:hypothetical protein